MITPRRASALEIECVADFPEAPPRGYEAILSKQGVSYYRAGRHHVVPIEAWIDPEYPSQAFALCRALGCHMGPTPSSTAMRLLRQFLSAPLGTSYAFTAMLRRCGAYGGGRTEVGVYGHHEGGLTDVDFSSAYGTLLATGVGDLAQFNVPLEDADFVDATVEDMGPYPVCRTEHSGRSLYMRSDRTRRLLTRAEVEACRLLEVHCTYRLERRVDVATFARTLLAMRPDYPVAKLLVNSVVGRLSVESLERLVSVPRPRAGDIYVCPGVFGRVQRCPPQGALSVSAYINGSNRGHLCSLLTAVANSGGTPLCWDTDGALLRGWNSGVETWGPFALKRRHVVAADVLAAKASVLELRDGEVEVRAGGVPGDPTADMLRRLIRPPRLTELKTAGALQYRADGGVMCRQLVADTGETRAYLASEVLRGGRR